MSIIISPSMQYIPKSWGSERIIVNNDLYCGKYLWIAQGHRFSYHYHKDKKESFAVQNGRVLMLYSTNAADLEGKKDKVAHALLFAEHSKLQPYGIFNVELGINYIILDKGSVFNIDPYMVHQVIAYEDSTILEISTHDDISDSYRIVLGG